jgi:hypothetical protein
MSIGGKRNRLSTFWRRCRRDSCLSVAFNFHSEFVLDVETKFDQCQCAADCKADSFLPSLSTSEATTLDGADYNSEVFYRYQRALEVASRVDEDAMASIMQKLQLVCFEFY